MITDQKVSRVKLTQLEEQLNISRQRRFRIFGDQNTEEVEKQLNEKILETERQLKVQQQSLNHLGTKVSTLQERTNNLKTATENRTIRIAREEQRFQQKLTGLGIASEREFKEVLLPKEEEEKLKEYFTDLERRRTEAIALLHNTRTSLKKEQEKNLTSLPSETISAELITQSDDLTKLQQDLGAINNKLLHQEKARKELQNRLSYIQKQEIECDYWSHLHQLIGSADGKKFRNFAQGLTFELMVHHANRTLSKMSDRYLLLRDPNYPLELNVMDNYQAGEVRSTANLSGGESFIVSLALALGLSSMASRNVQVDSLFLDEGFGTLDEDSLETALETLSSLQQEGKIIGIISHVPLLKQRITVQIQLTAGLDGRSRISGPGVTCNA